jgi:alkylhydroperoxidase family enzyme
MTWLPVTVDGTSERDAVLGLQAEAYASYRRLLEAQTAATDRELLEVCRARMAQMLDCREELARHSPERLAEVADWDRSPAITERERAALRFTEQFLVDPSLVDRELIDDLERELGMQGIDEFAGDPTLVFRTEAMVNFATAIAGHLSSMRLAVVLDLAPEAGPSR